MNDDFVAPFTLDNAPVRGRVVRLGAGALDPILRRHDYPRPVAMLLGEALGLASLVGSLLKSEGRLLVQAQGDGPVSLLVAEHNNGALRGYARLRDGAGARLINANRMSPAALLGDGALALTLEIENEAPYQGVVALDGETLAACAEIYFGVSEQTDTGIRLAVGEVLRRDAAPEWRAGGVLMQRIAGDDARGDTSEDWRRASILFATLTDEELIDPDLASDRLLYRLFHEEGVRMGAYAGVADQCNCSGERLTAVMRTFDPKDVRDLVEPDGYLHARCEFCGRTYRIAPEDLV